jgi:hypothetical protein
MSYIINLTNGSVYATIPDGTTNTNSGLTLIGRNYTSYGQVQNDNFVHLLENFADTIPPTQSSVALTPLTGTIWYDTVGQRLRVYDGTNWNMVSERIVSNAAPTSSTYTIKTGDQWYDTVNQQLNSWNGTTWNLIGPLYTASQGKSGSVVETITDTNNIVHTVVNTYTNGNLISITSFDKAFSQTAMTNFGNIVPGINLRSNVILNGNVSNSMTVGNVYPSQFARVDQNTAFGNNVTINGNIILSSANISYSNGALVVLNNSYQGNVDVYVNSYTGNVNALHIDGNTGLITVGGNAISSLGIATKSYVDAQVGSEVQAVQNVANQFYSNIQALQAEYLSNVNIINGTIANLQSNTNANLNSVHALIDGNVSSLTANINAYETWANANSISVWSNINTIDSYLIAVVPTLANINSPTFTGVPTTPQVANLNAYLSSINASSVNVAFNQSFSINAGDYITQYDTNGRVISNLKCLVNTSTSFYSNYAVIAGSITTSGTESITYTLGQSPYTVTFEPGLHVTSDTPNNIPLTFTALGDSGTKIATTLYVDASANIMWQDYTTRISNANTNLLNNINPLIALKANIAGQTFTGNVAVPYPSGGPLTWLTSSNVAQSGDSSGNVATTQFVKDSIANSKFVYTVSPTAPSTGNNGDFWFQTVN